LYDSLRMPCLPLLLQEENRGDASLAGSSAVREAEELLAEHSDGLEEAAAAEAAEEAMADDGDEMGDD